MSTSTTTGALVVTGGVGIGGNLNVGGGLKTSGALTATNITNSSLTANQIVYAGTNGLETGSSTFVYSGGNVGIGTGSPGQLLEIAANLHSYAQVYLHNDNTTTGDYGTQAMFRLGVGGNPIGSLKTTVNPLGGLTTSSLYLTTEGLYPIAFGLNNGATPAMLLNTSGYLGINTTSPTHRLEVTDTGSSNTPAFRINTTSNPGSGGFTWATSEINANMTAGNLIHMIGAAESSANCGYIGFNYAGGSGSNSNFLTFGLYARDNLVNILGNGNVGIGTTSPGYILDIQNPSPGLRVKALTSGGAGLYLDATTSAGASPQITFLQNGTTWWALGGGNIGAGGLHDFSLYNYGTSSNSFTISSSTNYLGIGTVSPTTNLTIGSTAAGTGAGGGLGAFLSRGVTTNFYEAYDGTKSYIAGVDNTQSFAKAGTLSAHDLAIVTSNSTKIYIQNSTGYVGIGTTNLSYQLQTANAAFLSGVIVGAVNGSVNRTIGVVILHQIGQSQGLQYSGKIYCNSWTGNSYTDVNILADYSTDAVSVQVLSSATNSTSNSPKVQLQLVKFTYSGGTYIGIYRSGGGSGVMYLDGLYQGYLPSYIQPYEITSGFTITNTIANLN